jgi:hypothetical protein
MAEPWTGESLQERKKFRVGAANAGRAEPADEHRDREGEGRHSCGRAQSQPLSCAIRTASALVRAAVLPMAEDR